MSSVKAIHVLWWGLASAALMVIGAFGPWAKVLDLVTINGTDKGGDGWIVVGAAVAGAAGLLLCRTRGRNWLVLTAVAATAALATTIYDRIDLEGTTNGVDVGPLVDAAWGIYAAMIGSLSLGIAAVVGWILASETPDAAAA